MVSIGLVYSIHDSIEVAIQKMIVTEIEMVKVVLYLVNRNHRQQQ